MVEIMDTKKPDPVARAARLLRESAQELRETATLPPLHQWTREDDAMARAAHDEYVAAADALEAWEISVGAPLRTGYDAARLEIESLQARLQEHVRSGKDWAMRAEALERTITTLRAQITTLRKTDTAAQAAWVAGLDEGRAQRDHLRGATEMVDDDSAVMSISLRQRADAWMRVCALLHELRPGWIDTSTGTAAQQALDAIRSMAAQK